MAAQCLRTCLELLREHCCFRRWISRRFRIWESSGPTKNEWESAMSIGPRTTMAWRIDPTRHRTENGCSSWRWIEHHIWMPCRLVPMDGSSPGRQVGPAGGACTFAAWSPDDKWMYVNSDAGGVNHIWRQRFPDGTAGAGHLRAHRGAGHCDGGGRPLFRLPPWRCRTSRYGFTTRGVSGRFLRWKHRR